MPTLSRRSFLTGPLLAAGSAALPVPGRAAAPAASTQGPGVYRYKLGDVQLTALYDGTWFLPIDDKFVRNASAAAVNEAFAAAFLAAQRTADFIHRAAGKHRLKTGADRYRHRRSDHRQRRLHERQSRRRRHRAERNRHRS